jgi:hypothetical protein
MDKRCVRLIAPVMSLLLLFPAVSSCTQAAQPATDTPQPPTAEIKTIMPRDPYSGSKVTLEGAGHASQGKITAYNWRSSLDGMLSDKSAFNTDNLTEGKHKIFFSVKDERGNWSEEVTGTVNVRSHMPPPKIGFFLANPTRIGLKNSSALTWHIEGAETVFINPDLGAVGQDGKLSVTPKLSTTYTLTAVNEGGSSSLAVDIIVVPKDNTGLPIINSFNANPGSINPGSSANLTWNVSGADLVQIDPGLGLFPGSGWAKVSPKQTTSYTISAQNDAGIIVSTTQLLVRQESGDKVDLVISDIYKTVTPLGVKLSYTIENRGSQTVPSSITRLYINGISKDIDTVPALPPGTKQEREFKIWYYNPAAGLIKVAANADNTVAETDISNNSMQIVFPVINAFDFIEYAADAKWHNGIKNIIFGGDENDIDGASLYQKKEKMEDGSGPGKYLETRPGATYGGMIAGEYKTGQIMPGDYFYGIAGLLEGAINGNVEFQVYISTGDGNWKILGEGIPDSYDYRLKSVVLPVPPEYYGRQVYFRLKVNNINEPSQNRAVWAEARIIR